VHHLGRGDLASAVAFKILISKTNKVLRVKSRLYWTQYQKSWQLQAVVMQTSFCFNQSPATFRLIEKSIAAVTVSPACLPAAIHGSPVASRWHRFTSAAPKMRREVKAHFQENPALPAWHSVRPISHRT